MLLSRPRRRSPRQASTGNITYAKIKISDALPFLRSRVRQALAAAKHVYTVSSLLVKLRSVDKSQLDVSGLVPRREV